MTPEQEKTINALTGAIHNVYIAPRKLYARSFLSGMFSALGATIGVAIIVTILSILVRHFGGLPVIGHWLTEAASVLQKKSN